MTEEQEDEPERETIRLVYVGPGNKPSTYVWRKPDGSLGVWGKLKARVAGMVYAIEAADGGDRVYPATMRWTGEYAEDAAQLQVAATAKEQAQALARLERNQSRTQAVDDTLGELLALAGKLTSVRDKRALADYVTARILRA